MTKYITYLRVSTSKQALGIDAQRALVNAHIKDHGGELHAEFIEKESGKKVTDEDRPQLHLALQMAKYEGCKILVAKVDRLARDLHFITALMKEEVPVSVAGREEMSKLEWHLMGMIAEHEADLISMRTKQALQALKDKGVHLGPPAWKLAKAQMLGGMGTREKARAYREKITPVIESLLKTDGFMTTNMRGNRCPNYIKLSMHLNSIGMTSLYGKRFNPSSLRALMTKAKIV